MKKGGHLVIKYNKIFKVLPLFSFCLKAYIESRIRVWPALPCKLLFSRRGTRLLWDKQIQSYPGTEDTRSLGPSGLWKMSARCCLTGSLSRLSLTTTKKSLSTGCWWKKISHPPAWLVLSVVYHQLVGVSQPRSQCCVEQGRCSWFPNSPEYERVS